MTDRASASTPGAATRPPQRSLRARVRTIVESRAFVRTIMALIVLNAITLGLETSPEVMAVIGAPLLAFDDFVLWVFTVELTLKIWVYRIRFFREGWNLFDLIIVVVAWLPSIGPFAVLRALRVLRVLRLISVVPQMRTVVGALVNSLPGMGAIVAVLMLVFYVASVKATKLFAAEFPQWFGTIGESMYTLFQIMTLESWSMGIVRPVMDVYPYAWVFFVPFVVVTSFAVLNLFIALIVNSMQSVRQVDKAESADMERLAHDERSLLLEEVRALRGEVRALRSERRSGPGR